MFLRKETKQDAFILAGLVLKAAGGSSIFLVFPSVASAAQDTTNGVARKVAFQAVMYGEGVMFAVVE